MDRIADTFTQAQESGRSCFVAYVCAGDPDAATSLEVCRTLLTAGVDVLELGVPFSDPLADGVANQLAAERALAAGMTTEGVFDLVRQLRAFSQTPIVLYTYYNMLYARGVDAYVRDAAAAGVDGILTLDLPPEEADELMSAAARYGVKTIFIVAPTTKEERVAKIAALANGFIYYVSQEGVTGERDSLATNVAESVAVIKRYTDVPVVVGFGISTPDQVRAVAGMADGVVVGSALVRCIEHNVSSADAVIDALQVKAESLIAGLSERV